MTQQVAITIPPHPRYGRVFIGTSQQPVDEMDELENVRVELDYFTPSVAARVEDLLLSEGYVVVSPWQNLIEFCVADIKPIH